VLLDGGDIAAVLVDPSMHHGGLWAGSSDYYKAVKKATAEAGALLIFDEVISGFRLAPGGGQEFYDVVPDLSVFGKALGVGEKLGAVVGRADVMAVADASGRSSGPFAFQSGTCSDSTAVQAAALATMTSYQKLGPRARTNRSQSWRWNWARGCVRPSRITISLASTSNSGRWCGCSSPTGRSTTNTVRN
jgi:glutamate-1-semialdehyde aminotransferase